MPLKDRIARNAYNRIAKKRRRDARRIGPKKNYKLTAEQRSEIIRRYLAKPEPMNRIARRHGVTQPNIWHLFRARGIATAPGLKRTHKLNEAAFDAVTECSAYWIGFLMADGCVHIPKKGGTPIINLTLQSRDKSHIQKFRRFLGSTHKVSVIRKPDGTTHHGVAFCSRRIARRLSEFGICPRKSLVAKAALVQADRHFWRGVIDGDGSLGFWKTGRKNRLRPQLALCGSQQMMLQFSEFIYTSLGFHVPSCRDGSIYRCSVSGARAMRAVEILYRNATVYLRRKNQLAIRIMHDNDSVGKAHPPMPPAFTEPEWEDIKNEHAGGKSTKQIARERGVHHSTICRHLKRRGAVMRRGRWTPCSATHRKHLSEARRRRLSNEPAYQR